MSTGMHRCWPTRTPMLHVDNENYWFQYWFWAMELGCQSSLTLFTVFNGLANLVGFQLLHCLLHRRLSSFIIILASIWEPAVSGQFVFRQKWCLRASGADMQHILLQIDFALKPKKRNIISNRFEQAWQSILEFVSLTKCLLSISKPNSMSIDWSSNTEKLDVRNTSSICTWATWTRPMIFCTPTPLATPAHRESTKRITLHRSAQAALIIVAWAPESTNALTGTPFTRQLMYLSHKCRTELFREDSMRWNHR